MAIVAVGAALVEVEAVCTVAVCLLSSWLLLVATRTNLTGLIHLEIWVGKNGGKSIIAKRICHVELWSS